MTDEERKLLLWLAMERLNDFDVEVGNMGASRPIFKRLAELHDLLQQVQEQLAPPRLVRFTRDTNTEP